MHIHFLMVPHPHLAQKGGGGGYVPEMLPLGPPMIAKDHFLSLSAIPSCTQFQFDSLSFKLDVLTT